MEPESHPCEKDKHLPNLDFLGSMLNFWGCNWTNTNKTSTNPWILQNISTFELPWPTWFPCFGFPSPRRRRFRRFLYAIFWGSKNSFLSVSGSWLNQPILQIVVKFDHLSSNRGEHKKTIWNHQPVFKSTLNKGYSTWRVHDTVPYNGW